LLQVKSALESSGYSVQSSGQAYTVHLVAAGKSGGAQSDGTMAHRRIARSISPNSAAGMAAISAISAIPGVTAVTPSPVSSVQVRAAAAPLLEGMYSCLQPGAPGCSHISLCLPACNDKCNTCVVCEYANNQALLTDS
jgi:hypothetical protein